MFSLAGIRKRPRRGASLPNYQVRGQPPRALLESLG